jgi:hypothetical protein
MITAGPNTSSASSTPEPPSGDTQSIVSMKALHSAPCQRFEITPEETTPAPGGKE